jgi:alpha-1,2-mannosyltransferase
VEARLRTSRALVVGCAIAAPVALVLVAKVAAALYYDPALWALAGRWVPPDGGTFIEAGGRVLNGQSPYLDVDTLGDTLGYVYPPILAITISPLFLLPTGQDGAMVWSVVLVACIAAALRLLGVRDWRCYVVALFWPFTRESLEYGAIGPVLVVLVAAMWRFRDRPWIAALALAAAVSAKLLLWPLVLWLVVTRRTRAAALSIASTLGLVFIPWAAIGFAGLAQYPSLLDQVAVRQEFRSFSFVALAHSLGSTPKFAEATAVLVGALLLALSVTPARDSRRPSFDRDRQSLTLAIAASLVFTPVVWSHYLVLLLVPVALARPRLSGLWLVVLASTVLRLFDWYRASPEGRLLPLVSIALLVAGVLMTAYPVDWRKMVRRARHPSRVRSKRSLILVGAAVAIFTLASVVPELLGDRPYNPIGGNSRAHAAHAVGGRY